MINETSNCFALLRKEAEWVKDFCTEPEKVGASLQLAIGCLETALTCKQVDPSLRYDTSFAKFANITTLAGFNILQTQIPSLIHECFKKAFPQGLVENEDAACVRRGSQEPQRFLPSPEAPKSRSDESANDSAMKLLPGASAQVEGQSFLPSIPFPFSDQRAKGFTDQQALQTMIEFLDDVNRLISELVGLREDMLEILQTMHAFICPHVQQCQEDLSALLLSISPNSYQRAPERMSSPPPTRQALTMRGEMTPGIATLPLIAFAQQGEPIPSIKSSVEQAIRFLGQIHGGWKKYFSEMGCDRPLLQSMDVIIDDHFQECIKELRVLLIQDQIEQERPAMVACTTSSSTAQCTSSSETRNETLPVQLAVVDPAKEGVFPQKDVQQDQKKGGNWSEYPIPKDFFPRLYGAVHDLESFGVNTRDMEGIIKTIENEHIKNRDQAKFRLTCLVANLSSLLASSCPEKNIRDTRIPAEVRSCVQALYPSKSPHDERQNLEELIEYWRLIVRRLAKIPNSKETQTKVDQTLSAIIDICLGQLETLLGSIEDKSQGLAASSFATSSLKAVRGSALHFYKLRLKSGTNEERCKVMKDMWMLIDGETAILCAREEERQTKLTSEIDAIIRLHVRTCINLVS